MKMTVRDLHPILGQLKPACVDKYKVATLWDSTMCHASTYKFRRNLWSYGSNVGLTMEDPAYQAESRGYHVASRTILVALVNVFSRTVSWK